MGTLESTEEARHFTNSDLKMTDEHGESLKASYSYGHPQEPGLVEEMIDIAFQEGAPLPEKISLSFSLTVGYTDGRSLPADQTRKDFSVTFPVEKQKFIGKKQAYPMNETVTIDEQTITVKRVTIYPIKTAIELLFDPKNTHRILGIDHMRIVNEKGEEWGNSGGITISHINEDHFIYYLDSPYFSQSQSLTLKADSLRALSKDQLDLVVDVRAKKLVKAPDNSVRLHYPQVPTYGLSRSA